MLGSWTDTFIFSWYVMFPLVFCSIISLAIILERIISLRVASVVKPQLARAIHELGYGGKTTLIEQLSVDEDTALSRLVRACLMYTSWPKDENADAVQAYARRENRAVGNVGFVFLEVVTGLGPLLGLMGTIPRSGSAFSVPQADRATEYAGFADRSGYRGSDVLHRGGSLCGDSGVDRA